MRRDPKEILDSFRIGEVQTLHELDDRIQIAILTIKLDCETLGEIHKYYDVLRSTLQRLGLDAHEMNIDRFLSELDNITQRLRNHRTQLEYLEYKIRRGVSLVRLYIFALPF